MLVSTVRFNQFLTATKTTLQQLAEMEPKRSVSYYSALAKGKKIYDKRESIKEKDLKRDTDREMKR